MQLTPAKADVQLQLAQLFMLSVQGSDKATRGHLKSQALLHQLKQKHLMQHNQPSQQAQLPAELHQMPAQRGSHKVVPKQHDSSVSKDLQKQDTSAAVKAHMPVRTRAQGGRKRRK